MNTTSRINSSVLALKSEKSSESVGIPSCKKRKKTDKVPMKMKDNVQQDNVQLTHVISTMTVKIKRAT